MERLEYRVEVKGNVPANLQEKISSVHAEAILSGDGKQGGGGGVAVPPPNPGGDAGKGDCRALERDLGAARKSRLKRSEGVAVTFWGESLKRR